MSKFTIVRVKKSVAKFAAAGTKPGKPKADVVVLQDNEDDTVTVFGQDAAGFQVPLDTLASLTPPPVSSDPTVLSVDAPTGMTYAEHGLKPGSATVTITATANDGSFGPFSFTDPVTCTAGPATSIIVTHGPAVPRP